MKITRSGIIYSVIFTCSSVFTLSFVTQHVVGQGPPPARYHTALQSNGISSLVDADTTPPSSHRVSIALDGGLRRIKSNGLPLHKVGIFPNHGNPHAISAQDYNFEIPVQPEYQEYKSTLTFQLFGVGVNGVPFDPSAAEWYKAWRGSEWRYEALSGAVRLGVDENYAHVQPNGAYHYHGIPWGLLKRLNASESAHSPLIGWAADGFPIYALYGYANKSDASGGIKTFKSSYRVKSGDRPDTSSAPGGTYDGTFIPDYEYVEGAGDLDACNGAKVTTPDFPNGTYAYFLTEKFPVIPRCFSASPDSSFAKRRGGRRGGGRPPHGFGPPPGGGPGFGPPPRR